MQFSRVRNKEDLRMILEIQSKNLARDLPLEEKKREGFVTVRHTFSMLDKMNALCPHVVILKEDRVVGYALSMLPQFRDEVPELAFMFDRIDQISYGGRLLGRQNYIVMGQICIDKSCRGQGLFSRLYEAFHKFNDSFTYCVTEVATENVRSMHAHLKVGFITIDKHPDKDGKEWSIVLWDWNKVKYRSE